MVGLDSREYFLSGGTTVAIARDSTGKEVARVPVRDYAISSAVAADWVIPSETNNTPSRTPLRGPASQVASWELVMNGTLSWTKVSPTAHRQQWTSTVSAHAVDGGPFPAHSMTVAVRNTGHGDMVGAGLFAFVYDSAGRPVDLIASDTQTVLEGASATFRAQSLASDDHCRGAADSQGYSADYWISYFAGSQLISQLANIRLP